MESFALLNYIALASAEGIVPAQINIRFTQNLISQLPSHISQFLSPKSHFHPINGQLSTNNY